MFQNMAWASGADFGTNWELQQLHVTHTRMTSSGMLVSSLGPRHTRRSFSAWRHGRGICGRRRGCRHGTRSSQPYGGGGAADAGRLAERKPDGRISRAVGWRNGWWLRTVRCSHDWISRPAGALSAGPPFLRETKSGCAGAAGGGHAGRARGLIRRRRSGGMGDPGTALCLPGSATERVNSCVAATSPLRAAHSRPKTCHRLTPSRVCNCCVRRLRHSRAALGAGV